jgi:Holliday junction resolvasome RuvABC endonuclease subunit
MIILGVDPSTERPAFSKIKVDRAGRVRILKYGKPDKLTMGVWLSLSMDADYVYLEDQYLGTNYASSKKLTFSAGELSGVAKLANAKVRLVPPSTWQSIMLGVARQAKREERKKISKVVASDIVKKQITDADIADAICIGYYGAKMMQQEKRKRE